MIRRHLSLFLFMFLLSSCAGNKPAVNEQSPHQGYETTTGSTKDESGETAVVFIEHNDSSSWQNDAKEPERKANGGYNQPTTDSDSQKVYEHEGYHQEEQARDGVTDDSLEVKKHESNPQPSVDRKKDKVKPSKEEGSEQEPSSGPSKKPAGGSSPEIHHPEPEIAANDEANGEASSGHVLPKESLDTSDEGWTELAIEAKNLGPVYTSPGSMPRLELVFADQARLSDYVTDHGLKLTSGGQPLVPLEHTHIDATLVGPVGRVFVQQRYTNPFDEVIEAVYVFPLPENSAVDGMRMVIGERVIEGVVRDKETARQMYEEAKSQGKVAALLEQERPNVFTQSVANIAPGMDINVDIRYVQDLTYDDGGYEFVFPMVVGPRYIPDERPLAERVDVPVFGKGSRPGHDISLSLRADAGLPIASFEVPTHEVKGSIDKKGILNLSLKDKDELPNRDFVLRYQVAGENPEVAVLSETLGDQGYFTMIVQPPEAEVNKLLNTRQMVFVVDVSGSMAGVPLSLSKEAMNTALSRLRPVDTFNIITFASGTKQLFPHARPANRNNIEHGLAFIDKMDAAGGTEMLEGIAAAVEAPIEAGMSRAIVFMTDGYIGNEDEVLERVGKAVDGADALQAKIRVFGFGVGASTNRYLIEGLAKEGDGSATFALTREDPALAVDSIYRVIDHPIFTDVELDFGELSVDTASLYPKHIPDLMVSRPLVVHGQYSSPGEGEIKLKAQGQSGEIEMTIPVKLEAGSTHEGLMGSLWARSAVASLQREMLYSADYEGLKSEIIALGVEHGIVTQFTSFIAIDEASEVEGGGSAIRKVDQPTGLPEDTTPR